MENVPNNTVIGQITAFDDDDDLFGEVEYSLSEEMFTIDKQTGEIFSNGQLDREVRPIFNFQGLATDGGKLVSNYIRNIIFPKKFFENFLKKIFPSKSKKNPKILSMSRVKKLIFRLRW